MSGFTVTDEAVEAAAKSIWEGVETEIAWPPSEDSYDDAEVVRATARAALEAAARTAQPTSSDWQMPPSMTGISQAERDRLAAKHATPDVERSSTEQPPVASTLDREAVLAILDREQVGTTSRPGYSEYRNGIADAILALVPQPTPIADRQQLAEVLDHEAFDPHRERSKHTAAVIQWAARQHMAREGADRLLAAGVFKTEAEVRATAIEEVAEAYLYDGDRDSQLPGYVALIECAAAIRAGGQ